MYRKTIGPLMSQFLILVVFTIFLASIGCSQGDVAENTEVVIDGSRDVRLAITLHMDGIASQIEQRASKKRFLGTISG